MHCHRSLLFVTIATSFAGATAVSAATQPSLKVGYGEVFPFSYTRSGQPAGFTIDVFNEAARRERIAIQWVRAGDIKANDQAIAERRLDMVPMGHPSPERTSRSYVSEPWWSLEMVLVSRADSTADPNRPHSLAVTNGAFSTAAAAYPGTALRAVRSANEAATEVCLGKADAAFLGAVFLRELLLRKTGECRDVSLRTVDSTAEIQLSIISHPALRTLGDRLRTQISRMTLDGTLAAIAARHPPVSAPRAIRMAEAMRTSYERERLRILFSAAVLIALIAAVFVARQRSTIRKQKVTEQDLRESRRVLEQRTKDLLRSNEDLQSFAYSLSHDLQEPLRNQSLYTELLERRYRELLPPGALEYVAVVRKSALEMNETMKSLLVYSRAGQTHRKMSRIDCGEVLRTVLSEMDPLLSTTEARVSVGRLPEVMAWEDRLDQVFRNLIENAIKYRKPGTPPVVDISCRHVDGGWLFSVADNGIGFHPEYAEKIFEVFKRLHSRDTYGGSGIGLALCRRIIERHGGRVWAESVEGAGSTFYFTLPDAVEASPEDGPVPPDEQMRTSAGSAAGTWGGSGI